MKTIKQEERTRCEVWSRVMGYHRPVDSFNAGKQQEFRDRKFFLVPKQNACAKDRKPA
jgi:hypothetical protein